MSIYTVSRIGPPVVAAFVFGVLYVVARILARNTKIQQLGGRAVGQRPSKVPFGIDTVYSDLKAHQSNTLIERIQQQLLEQNHTMEHTAVGGYAILTDEPENIKAVLATQFGEFGKGPQFHEVWKDFLGESIFNADGELWRASRKLLQPQFNVSRVSDLDCIERSVQKLISLLPTSPSSEPVDMFDLFMRFTLDTATDFLLGECVGSLDNSHQDFARAFGRIQYWQFVRVVSGPFSRLVPTKELRGCIATVDRFVNGLIQKSLNTSAEKVKNKNEYTFLDALTTHTRDPKQLRDQLMSTMIAARDTVATTLAWSLHVVSRRKDVAAKLRAEVLEVVGTDRRPTYDDLKRMAYLKHFVSEVLRLYPAVPLNIRESVRDTSLPVGGERGPVGLPKRTPVVYSVFAMHRRKDLVGPDAEEFRPERWAEWTPRPWTYLPFNGGPRICLGQTFALAEIHYTLARIMQSFSVVECCQEKEQGFSIEVLLRPEHPVFCRFRE